MQSANFLTISNLWVERGQRDLCKGLSFTVQIGEVLRIVGENGAGKSSLLKVLMGTAFVDEGTISYLGEDVTNDRSSLQKEAIYIGHSTGVKRALTVRENLALHCPDVSFEHYQQAMVDLGLISLFDTQVSKLSQGQARRVALSRLWLSEKRLWVLDEPFTALDAQGRILLENKIQQHISSDGVVIITTHTPLSTIHARELILTP